MPELNPELQERLDELERELEVRPVVLSCRSPSRCICGNIWSGESADIGVFFSTGGGHYNERVCALFPDA